MSSKSKKGSTSASTCPRPSSPLSPTRYSRIQEKQDLQNLNDRLAGYIDKTRRLEQENSRLTKEIHTTNETVTREVTNIKTMYDNELADARKLIDDTHKEKVRLEIDVKRLLEENDELRAELAKKTKDCALAESTTRMYETKANELQLKYNQANQDAKKAMAEARDLEKERDKLKKLVDEHRKHLEEESLARVEIENANQSLREEMTFNSQVLQQQLNESRTRRQVELSEIDGQLAEKYETKLKEALQDLRAQYENQMASNREEIEALYESKIKNMQASAHRNTSAAANALDELRSARSRIEQYSSKISDLENQNQVLLARNRDLEKMLENERMRHAEDLAALEAEIAKLRDEMTTQMQEYQDLIDVKVSLDLEIAAYRKLLESEEARLNITPEVNERESSHLSTRSAASSTSRRTPVRGGAKRKRTVLEESNESSVNDFSVNSTCKGDVEISDADSDGKYVRLHNKSAQEVAIGGWQVLRKAGDNETVYKFHRSIKLEPRGVVTIWSSDLNKDHEPPSNLVMKGQKWVTGDSFTTTLLNNNGDEVALSERAMVRSSNTSRISIFNRPFF